MQQSVKWLEGFSSKISWLALTAGLRVGVGGSFMADSLSANSMKSAAIGSFPHHRDPATLGTIVTHL